MNDLTRKPTPEAALNKLNDEERDRLLKWLQSMPYRIALKKIALPPPEGLGLQVSRSALSRFWARHMPRLFLQQRNDYVKDLRLMAAVQKQAPAPYPELSRGCLEAYHYKLALNPHENLTELIKLTDVMTRVRALELREKESQLRREQLRAQASQPTHNVNLKIHATIDSHLKKAITAVVTKPQPPAARETGQLSATGDAQQPQLPMRETQEAAILVANANHGQEASQNEKL